MTNSILHLLGLAKKAGRLEVGEEPVGAAARSRQARLILVASDAADNSCRRAAHFAEAGNILWLKAPFTKAELGDRIGRGFVAMIAVTDAGFAATITEKLVVLNPEYAEAAEALRKKADRVYARQREQRQHEKNLARGKHKPWAVPAPKTGEKKTKKSRPNQTATAGSKSHDGSKPSSVQSNRQGVADKKTIKKGYGQKLRVSRGGVTANKTLRNEVAAHDE